MEIVEVGVELGVKAAMDEEALFKTNGCLICIIEGVDLVLAALSV